MYKFLADGARFLLTAEDDQELERGLVFGAWLYLFVTGIITTFIPAPYGKFSENISNSLIGRLSSIKLQPALAWSLQEVPSFLISLLATFHIGPTSGQGLLLLPFLLHYANRSLLYPLLLSKGSKPVPLLTTAAAFLFCAYNGLLQSQAIANLNFEALLPWTSCIGLIIFLLGMAINIHSDSVLRGLRKEGETGYKIPHGGLFFLLSSPHYFGECIEWCGFAALTQVGKKGNFV